MNKHWKKVEEKTEEHWLELTDPEGWWSAAVKWDGCIHLTGYANSPSGPNREDDPCDDYIHICDIDQYIEKLQALKQAALEFFGPDWPL